ncbi:MAG: hypothetical protein ACP5Q1_09285 [Anaerolineae bacterium]
MPIILAANRNNRKSSPIAALASQGYESRLLPHMNRLLRVLFVASLALSWVFGAVVPTRSQVGAGTGVRYFHATGHNVQGEFLAFFDRYGGEEIFGLPRTEEFIQDGLKVQYFQRVRMEHHPYNPAPYRVQLTLLGDLLGYRAPPIPASSIPPPSHPQRRYYPQTGHTLSYTFLEYFDRHGGLDVFGYPITELILENGIVVQYFQRGKMEWHPENPIPYQVTLGNLGDEYIRRTNLPASYLAPVAPLSAPAEPQGQAEPRPTEIVPPSPIPPEKGLPTPPSEIPQIIPTIPPTPVLPVAFAVSTWVKYPMPGQGGPQTVYVRVMDSWGNGVANASVEATVHFRGGDQVFSAGSTDASGYCSFTFSIGDQPLGYTVLIDVRVTYGGRTVTAQTSFIPWR